MVTLKMPQELHKNETPTANATVMKHCVRPNLPRSQFYGQQYESKWPQRSGPWPL